MWPLQDAQKGHQQGRSRWKHRLRSPGYVEDAFEVRTTLMGFFSILPIFRCSPLPTSGM